MNTLIQPSAGLLTTGIAGAAPAPDPAFTVLSAQWGQFDGNDLILANVAGLSVIPWPRRRLSHSPLSKEEQFSRLLPAAPPYYTLGCGIAAQQTLLHRGG